MVFVPGTDDDISKTYASKVRRATGAGVNFCMANYPRQRSSIFFPIVLGDLVYHFLDIVKPSP